MNTAGVTLAVAGTATLLPGGSTGMGGAGEPVVDAQLQTPADARVQALMRRFGCRTDGFDGRQVPRSSLVRRADGRVAVVSFERGWKVFERAGAGSLVAVCLRPPR